MNVMVTGATGFVGLALCRELVARGAQVRALCRSRGPTAVLERAGVSIHRGSLEQPEALREAMRDCAVVYHLAALAAVGARHSNDFHRVNVEGTRRVLAVAMEMGVQRVVHTSTAGVLSPSRGTPVTEDTPRTAPWFSAYERTKAAAEDVVRDHVQAGLDAVIVNPSRVYGPTPADRLPPVDDLLRRHMLGTWRILPGTGQAIGNYVSVGDVAVGHVLAAERGRTGERYILGGANVTFRQLFDAAGVAAGQPRRMWPIPAVGLVAVASALSAVARMRGRAPPISAAWVRRYLLDWELSSDKATRELGYRPSDLAEGLARTMAWLRDRE